MHDEWKRNEKGSGQNTFLHFSFQWIVLKMRGDSWCHLRREAASAKPNSAVQIQLQKTTKQYNLQN